MPDAEHPDRVCAAGELELDAIVKASQAISREIDRAKLVATVMTTTMQIGGADRGLLILCSEGAERVVAEARAIGSEVAVVATDATLTECRLPISLIRQVISSRKHVLSVDASRPPPNSDEPHLCGEAPGSILCLPLLTQGKTGAVLYLEARSDKYAFTSARTDALKLLAAVSAVSLDNARLYSDLKRQGAQVSRLFECNVIGYFTFDWTRETLIHNANDMVLNLLGYTRQDLESGKIFWSDLTPPEGTRHDRESAASLRATGRAEPRERDLIRKDGSRIPVLVGGALFEGSTHEGIGFLLDLTERKQAELRQKLLIDELNHRVKNTLTTVQSVCAQTLRTAASPEVFKDEFDSRLMALSNAHNVLNRTGWQGASLREILDTVLAPYRQQPEPRFEIAGDDVSVAPTSAVTLGMAFHELATNAVKYGALSIPSGRVSITFHERASRRLEIVWQEWDGPPVHAPKRRGFGSRLIERSLPKQLSGQVRLQFLPQGVRCEMDASLDEIRRDLRDDTRTYSLRTSVEVRLRS